MKFRNLHGYLEYRLRDRRRSQESKVGVGDTEFNERIMEEHLKLEVDGYAYHPNLFDFSLAGLFGLQQQQFEDVFGGVRRESSDAGPVTEFELTGEFFKKKPYPGSVYARRFRSLDARPFQSSLETTTTSFGFFWQYVSEKTPASLLFSDTDIRLEPLDDRDASARRKNTQLKFNIAYRFNTHNVLSFEYARESIEEEPFGFNYDSDEVTVSHQLAFGKNVEHQLDSELNYFEQRGIFQIERVRWREFLRLTHSDSLKSWYRFEAMDRTQGSLAGVTPIDETSFLLSGTVEHRLFASLVSQFHAYGQTQSFDSGLEIDRLGAQASFSYRKTNRWGFLQASYRAAFQREERSGGVQDFETLDEQHTFSDPEPIRLAGRSIVGGTIVVTDENRTTLYQPGQDYRIREIGEEVELERIPTGRIIDGQTLLIDYITHFAGDFTLDTITQFFDLRQNFDFGLAPYYRFRWQDQELSPKNAIGAVPDDITAHTLGVEYRRGSLRLTAELEDYDSTLNPFEAIRLTADYTHRFKFKATASVTARYSDVSFRGRLNRETTFYSLEGSYRHPINRYFTVEGSAIYRSISDSLSGDDDGIDLEFSLEWFIRQTELRLSYEFKQFEDDFSKNESSVLFVQVRRKF